MTKNPWIVESLEAFACLKCPECVFHTKEENNFQDHAVKHHPLSLVLFALFSPGLPLLPYYIQVTDYNIITQFRKILFAFALQRSNMLSGFKRLQANLAHNLCSQTQTKVNILICFGYPIT